MKFSDPSLARWYEAAPLGFDEMRAVMHPEVEFHVCEGWPAGGTYFGPDSVLVDLFPRAARAWESLKPHVDEVIASGDVRVVSGRYEGVAANTRTPFSAEFVHIWRLRDGLLLALRQVADSAVLARANGSLAD